MDESDLINPCCFNLLTSWNAERERNDWDSIYPEYLTINLDLGSFLLDLVNKCCFMQRLETIRRGSLSEVDELLEESSVISLTERLQPNKQVRPKFEDYSCKRG